MQFLVFWPKHHTRLSLYHMFYLWLCSGSLIERVHSFYYLLGEWSFPSMCPYSNLILRPGRFHSSVEVSMSLLLIAHCLSIHALRIHLLVVYFLYATMIRGLSANVFIAWVQRVHSHVLTNDTKNENDKEDSGFGSRFQFYHMYGIQYNAACINQEYYTFNIKILK